MEERWFEALASNEYSQVSGRSGTQDTARTAILFIANANLPECLAP